MSEKRGYLSVPHIPRMPQIVKANETDNPIAISSFGAQTVMSYPNHIPDLIEQSGFVGERPFRDHQTFWSPEFDDVIVSDWFVPCTAVVIGEALGRHCSVHMNI